MHVTNRVILTLLVASAGVSGSASAQSPAAPAAPAADPVVMRDSTPATAVKPAGPTIASATAGIRAVRTDDLALAQRRQPQSMGRPMSLMIVGGAAVFLGAVIGGDVGTLFMIGGSAAILIGLYEYLK